MKKQVLLFSLMLLFPIVASADAVEINGIYYNLITKDGNWAEVTNNPNNYSGEIVIPESVEYESATYRVTSIGNRAFYSCFNLISITIPNSVASIGISAFYSCLGLTSVTIPNSVTTIGEGAFTGCSNLTSVTIPNSLTSIGSRVFHSCSGLTSVTIPNSVTNIGNRAFYRCYSLTSVTIPNSVTSISERTFQGCSGLTSITIPNSVTSIGDYAFYGCSGLTSIVVESGNTKYDSRENCNAIIEKSSNTLIAGCHNTIIPNSVTSICQSAFYQCIELRNITIPNSVTSIGQSAFEGCSGLTSVTIPNSVTSIAYSVFSDCSGLTSVTIPNSVTTISEKAFYNCSGLKSIIIGKKVNSIENEAFANCKDLADVYCHAENVPTTNYNVFGNSYIEYATLHVPAVSVNSYKAAEPWKNFKEIVALETTDIFQIEDNTIIIRTENDQISVSGANDGTAISVFATNGLQIGSAVCRSGQAVINTNLSSGSIAIVKIGEKSVKVAVK